MNIPIWIVSMVAMSLAFNDSNCRRGVRNQCSKKGRPTACSLTRRSRYNIGDHRKDPKFVESMIARHNYYRSRPFTGPGGPFTGADIVAVEWDKELEVNAWIWANQMCEETRGTDNRRSGHDTCRVTPSYGSVGQNVAWSGGDSWSAPIDVDKKALSRWYAEMVNIRNASTLTRSFSNLDGNGKPIGHYTQLMWAKTYRIGCAYVTSRSPKYKIQGWVVCNYGAAGNYLNEKVFTKGRLGSRCRPGSVRGGSNGLCRVNKVARFRRSVGVKNAT